MCSLLLDIVIEKERKALRRSCCGPRGPGRLGCALQPIACGVSDGLYVYLPLCFGLWLVSLPLVINFIVVNKACTEELLPLCML